MTAGDVITIVEDNVAKKGNYFDGDDDYVLHDAHAVARVAANDTVGTYSAWIYLDYYSAGNRTILSAGDNDSATEFLRFGVLCESNLNKLRIYLYHGDAIQCDLKQTATSETIPLRTWTHVAVVQNGTKPALYVNGSVVELTNTVTTDTTYWYDKLTGCDKFAIGVKESNNTHLDEWKGAIGQVKYWNRALSAAEILQDYNGEDQTNGDYPDSTYLVFNITMENDGITDSGTGADNGTLTGNAHYGGLISSHSIALERNCTGHAAERSTTFQVSPTKLCSVIVRGD